MSPAPVAGFFGKIPSRGDFVRAGLPRSFVAPWDDWLQAVIFASREALGESWLPAWLEAPVWRFRLQPGACGPDGAAGVFMPSMDRAGRYFPLTLARIAAGRGVAGDGWLEVAEAAGMAALEQDIEPDALAAMLEMPGGPDAGETVPEGACVWWTRGAPRVPASAFATAALPDAALFTRMLDAQMQGFQAAALPPDMPTDLPQDLPHDLPQDPPRS